jgi:superfamily II DNA or RNA helicase
VEHEAEFAVRDGAQVLPTLIDNRPGNTLLEAVKRLMAAAQSVDIATGYFEVGALVALDGAWRDVRGALRLLMGDELTRQTKAAILEGLGDSRRNGIEQAKVEDDWGTIDRLHEIRDAIATGKIVPRVYTKAKFHAKAMHYKTGGVVNHGIIGSSNFTRRGMTENIELNLFTSDNSQLRDLEDWFERAWGEAEDIRPELLKIIEPHVREYSPFEVYLRAMRERFFGLEPEEITWERNESRIYPILAQYQRDAYHDLMRHATEWGGGLLCDGVGLGKTHVALMLIERARRDKMKVLIIAPNATIPSVWQRLLSEHFPEDFGDHTDDIRLCSHTDLERDSRVSDEVARLLGKRYDVVIVDEAHHFRVPHRNRSRRLKIITRGNTVFLLTATPINNTPLDLYHLLNYIAQDDRTKFARVGVPDLRRWFNQRLQRDDLGLLQLTLANEPEFQDFLRHVMVMRSRKYVKTLDKQEDPSVKFPERALPEVIEYSLQEVYGDLLPEIFKAFDSRDARIKLVLYETERFKQQKDEHALQEQSNVVGLVRTMMLKRFESSQEAFVASLEDLLYKHMAVLEQVHPIKAAAWRAEHEDLWSALQNSRRERLALNDEEVDAEDEEEDSLPLTAYELRKTGRIKDDIAAFGDQANAWFDALDSDMTALAGLLHKLRNLVRPETDAKLLALVKKINSTKHLRERKIVIFSEFKDTARYLERQLRSHFPNDSIVEVDSARAVTNREKIIRRFAPYYNSKSEEELNEALNDPIRILVSTDVLSEGLNLQDANIIINYDLHWNPVRLMQRIGRVDRRMDPSKPVNYEKVYVYNFLPPRELDDVLQLYRRVSGKLIAINRAIGIEAPVLTANDDAKARDYYLNIGEGELTAAEKLRLKAHELATLYPEAWEETAQFPNRVYSGKRAKRPKALFLCYRLAAQEAAQVDQRRSLDVRWVMIDVQSGEITEDLAEIHKRIACEQGTPRVVTMPREERTRLRKQVESEWLNRITFQRQTPAEAQDELLCWMEV